MAACRLCDMGTIAERGKVKKGLFGAFGGVGAMPNIGQGAKMRFRGVFERERGKGGAALCVAWRVGARLAGGQGVPSPMRVREAWGRCYPYQDRAKIFWGTF